jgi:outer membrane protein assembly factor BamB
MNSSRLTPVLLSQRAARLLGGTLSILVLSVLTACGSSKPAPAPLESLTPVVRLSTVWSQRIGAVEGPLSLASSEGVITTASTDGEIVAFDAVNGALRWRAQAKGGCLLLWAVMAVMLPS